jgi:hypothetical protein
MLYRIKNWAQFFENNRTKELKRMAWVPMPNKMDGTGYTWLVDHANGAAHFGAWCAIVEIASRCEPRGTLSREGAMSPHDLARISRLPATLFEEVIPRLLEIQWLEGVIENSQEAATIPQEGAALRARAGGNGTEGNGTERTDSSDIDYEKISAPGADLLKATGLSIHVKNIDYPLVERLITVGGLDAAKEAIAVALSKGIGGKGALTYAEKVLAGNAAKRDLQRPGSTPREAPLTKTRVIRS